MRKEVRDTVLIVAHDAGGAEIVSSWAKKHITDSVIFCVQGPAITIFSNKIPDFINLPIAQLAQIFKKVSLLLMGTSWKSDFERLILKQTKSLGIKTVAFLDHWSNYEIRFKLGNDIVLPDEIWTGDEYAHKLASKIFTQIPVLLKENPYIEDILHRGATYNQETQNDKKLSVLYVCEPSTPVYGYTEFQALSNYLDHKLKFSKSPFEIRLRLHPSEDRFKYAHLITSYSEKIHIGISSQVDIVSDCLWADEVVGCQTYALVIALKLGKKVFSCIPATGKPCLLPYPEIIQLFQQNDRPTEALLS